MKSIVCKIGLFILIINLNMVNAQIIIANKNFSFGTTGRIGAAISPNSNGNTGRQLNLNNQGSLGGRLDQGDYVDFLPAVHFYPVLGKDSTQIDMQARLMFYSSGTFLGNVDTNSTDGTIVALSEAFIEARNIMGSQWSVWAGAKWQRYDDIHIDDYFYFDDHSSTGFGIKYKKTSFSMFFPAAVDTLTKNPLPYSFNLIISGKKGMTYRQRQVAVIEQTLNLNKENKIKLLGEFHYVGKSGKQAQENYPEDFGWVIGAKLNTELPTSISGSFNQFAIRYGSGIANGGEGGNTQTWRTFGAPNEDDRKYKNAYSITAVEHFLWNYSHRWSFNAYAVYTQSKGGAKSNDIAEDFFGREIMNKKNEFNTGIRTTYYLTNWFHILTELHYAMRKDGKQPQAEMYKFVLAPTLVPTAERSVWARPHIRLIAEIARYNDYAKENLYSPFLQQAGNKRIGTYFGVRAEWWIF